MIEFHQGDRVLRIRCRDYGFVSDSGVALGSGGGVTAFAFGGSTTTISPRSTSSNAPSEVEGCAEGKRVIGRSQRPSLDRMSSGPLLAALELVEGALFVFSVPCDEAGAARLLGGD